MYIYSNEYRKYAPCRHYYYEKEVLIYGFYEESTWKFGMKDRGRNNGYAIKMDSLDALYVNVEVAGFPL